MAKLLNSTFKIKHTKFTVILFQRIKQFSEAFVLTVVCELRRDWKLQIKIMVHIFKNLSIKAPISY